MSRIRCRSLSTTTAVEELSAAGPDPAFSGPVLPGTAVGDVMWLGAQSLDALDHRGAEYGVTVEDQISRRRVIWERLTQLLHHPGRRRRERGVEVNNMSPAVLDDEETVKHAK